MRASGSVLAASAVLGGMATSHPVEGQACFSQRVAQGVVDSFPVHAVTADLNGDGALDIVAAGFSGGTLRWFASDGAPDPTFADDVIAVGVGAGLGACFDVCDLDGDGDLDIVLGNAVQLDEEVWEYSLLWFENDGADQATFMQRELMQLTRSPDAVACGDLDMDGDADIAVLAVGSDGLDDRLYWLTNDGAAEPSFGASSMTTSSFSAPDIEIADANNDGLNDISAIGGSSGVQYFRNLGTLPATFAEKPLAPGTPAFSFGGHIATDLNGDGFIDYVVSRTSVVTTLINDGATPPTFAAHDIAITPPEDFLPIFALGSGDYDGDGDVDITAAVDGTIYLLDSDDAMNALYTVSVAVQSAPNVWSMSAADLDNDGDDDLVTGIITSFSPLHWYESVSVRNATTGAEYRTLAEAISAASPDDVIDADPVHFDGLCASAVLDFGGKALTLRSTHGVTIPQGAEAVLSDGGVLEAAPGAPVVLSGTVRTPTMSASSVVGDRVVVEGDLDLGPGSVLLTEGATHFSGRPSFLERAIGELSTSGGSGVVAVDLDGDDDLDLVSTGSVVLPPDFNSTTLWWRNTGGLTPTFEAVPLVPIDTDASAVAVGDFDGDSNIDVFLSSVQLEGHTFYVARNNGGADPMFKLLVVPSSIGGNIGYISLFAAGNLDDDVADEVVVGFAGGAAWYDFDLVKGVTETILPSLPPGSEAEMTSYSLDVGDLDGDGDLDIAQGTTRGAVWYENNGASPPSFVLHVLSDVEYGAVGTMTIGDIDGDGDKDVVGARGHYDSIVIYENDGTIDPSFIEIDISTPNVNLRTIDLADMDGDGDADVVGGSYSDETVWYESTSTSPLTLRRRDISGQTRDVVQIVIADLNGDGRPDVATASNDSQDVRWFENSPTGDRVIGTGSTLISSDALQLENVAVVIEEGAVLGGASALTIDRNSVVSGCGVLQAPIFRSGGVLQPAAGSELTIDGDYEQFFDDPQFGLSAGTLRVNFESLGDGDGLTVGGTASLRGLLEVRVPAGASPDIDFSFTVLTAAEGLDGSRFDAAILPGLPNGTFFKLKYTDGGPGRGAGSVALVVAELDSGPVDIDPQEPTPLSGLPSGAALGDVAGFNPEGMPVAPDGLPDLAVVIPDDNNPLGAAGQLVVLVNEGDGGDGVWDGFGGGTLIASTRVGGEEPVSVSLGDLDGDKDIDLAVANRAGGSVTAVLNDGLGGISPLVPVSAGVDRPRFVAAHDLDSDGRADLAVAGTDATTLGGQVAGLISAGAPGQFAAPVVTSFGTSLVYASLGDLDGDKDIDLVVADSGESAVHTFVNEPGVGAWPGFTVGQTIPVGAGVVQASLGDLDGDKDIDLLTANLGAGTVSLSLNDGAGALGPVSSLPAGAQPRSLAIADLDNDLDPDFAVIVNDENAPGERLVRVFRNDLDGGQLAFAPALDSSSTLRPRIALSQVAGPLGPLATRDIDNDGDDDVVTVNENPPSARGSEDASAEALLQITMMSEACPADVTGDGVVDTFDLAQMLAGWGQAGISDLTGDGTTDTFDLAVTLAGWGACP